ncbi:MAG: hypothetical protein FWD61_13785 [Phycisphaerales bacterium]|nr:hypothetical protein [Phycisphaerales bacterium]
MAVSLAWQLAAEASPEAEAVRRLLVRLSRRQIKRGRGRPTFTVSSLVAGLEVFLSALHLLSEYSPEELHAMALAAGLPVDPLPPRPKPG